MTAPPPSPRPSSPAPPPRCYLVTLLPCYRYPQGYRKNAIYGAHTFGILGILAFSAPPAAFLSGTVPTAWHSWRPRRSWRLGGCLSAPNVASRRTLRTHPKPVFCPARPTWPRGGGAPGKTWQPSLCAPANRARPRPRRQAPSTRCRAPAARPYDLTCTAPAAASSRLQYGPTPRAATARLEASCPTSRCSPRCSTA